MKNKKAIEMGFNWLFALIAGAFILFLAIYAAGNLIKTGQTIGNTMTAKEFISIFDPETGIASGISPGEINFKTKTSIYFNCDEISNPPFGKQDISMNEKTFGKDYGQVGNAVLVRNKYIFSENVLEGKQFYMFSMGFSMPFKISDLIIVNMGNYCFYKAPSDVKDDLNFGLRLKNIQFPNTTQQCEGTKVCFDAYSGDCDIKVASSAKYVQKQGKKLYYEGNLIYAAIFSSPEIYECNVKRLMNKFNELGNIYIDKIKIIERKNCQSNVQTKLVDLMAKAKALESSSQLKSLIPISQEIDSINNGAAPGCELYKNDIY